MERGKLRLKITWLLSGEARTQVVSLQGFLSGPLYILSDLKEISRYLNKSD